TTSRRTDMSTPRSTTMGTTGKHLSRDTTGGDRVDAAACRLYDAEWALHVARQTQVDAWIAVAYQTLHSAVAEHLAAIAELQATSELLHQACPTQANPPGPYGARMPTSPGSPRRRLARAAPGGDSGRRSHRSTRRPGSGRRPWREKSAAAHLLA